MKNKIYSNIFEYTIQAVSFLIFRKSQARFLIAGFLFKNCVHYTGIDRDPGFNPVSRDPEPFYPDPSRFEFKIPDFYLAFLPSNLTNIITTPKRKLGIGSNLFYLTCFNNVSAK